MKKRYLLAIMALALPLVSGGARPTTRAGRTALPAIVRSAEGVLEDWVGTLHGKTEKQILQELGDAPERTTWRSGDGQGLQLSYQFSAKSKVWILFSKDRVVYADVVVATRE